jgi:hypothetical protein
MSPRSAKWIWCSARLTKSLTVLRSSAARSHATKLSAHRSRSHAMSSGKCAQRSVRPRSRERGTSRAHYSESCPEPMRTFQISTADQNTWAIGSPWSGTCLHETRPAGRLVQSTPPPARPAYSRPCSSRNRWTCEQQAEPYIRMQRSSRVTRLPR